MELDIFGRHRPPARQPTDEFPADGVISGYATIGGRPVVVFAEDLRSVSETRLLGHHRKILQAVDWAATVGCSIVGIYDGPAVGIQQDQSWDAAQEQLATRKVRLSGVVPQITIVMGPCEGGTAYIHAVTDFVIMVDQASGIRVVDPPPGTQASPRSGDAMDARTHSTLSGIAHFWAPTEAAALQYTRRLLSYLPNNSLELPPSARDSTDKPMSLEHLDSLVPESCTDAYDMRILLDCVVDDFLEIHELFAPSVICGFGRVSGRAVGVVANQPLRAAGPLDDDASSKAARFVLLCDSFQIPILTFADIPDSPPKEWAEWKSVRYGARLLYAYAEATVPKVSVVTRMSSDEVSYVGVGSRLLRSDVTFVWPPAQAALGVAAAGYRNSEFSRKPELDGAWAALVAEYERDSTSSRWMTERFPLEAAIDPSETLARVIDALRILGAESEELPPKKHGCLPI